MDDFILFLKAEFLDEVYLQQDAFHHVDGASSADRQQHVFGVINEILGAPLAFPSRDKARQEFVRWQQMAKDWNRTPMEDPGFAEQESNLLSAVKAFRTDA